MAHNPTDNRPFPFGLTCRTCRRPVSANEPTCPDCHRANRIKCPQCGKMVNNHFPYCEWCASPLGDNLESPPLSRPGGGGNNRRALVVGYRPAGRFLKTVVVGGTFVACAGFIGWGVFLLHDTMLLLSGKLNTSQESENIYGTSYVAGNEGPILTIGREELPPPVQLSPKPYPASTHTPTPVPALTPTPVSEPEPVTKPESSSLIKPIAWRHSSDWYASEGKAMLKSLKDFCAGGYRYNKDCVYEFAEKYKALMSALNQKDPLKSDEAFAAVSAAYHAFKETVAWQRGLAHPKFPHVLSSAGEGRWIAEEGWEFVYPGTSDFTVRRKAPIWAKPKEWYEREYSGMEKHVRLYTSGGYRYPRGEDVKVFRQIQSLRQRLNADDPEGSARAYSELKDMYNTFVNQCQWASGLRHPKFPHVLSSAGEGRWIAEEGWEFVYPGTSDLTVRRKAPTWVRPKEWFERECSAIEKNVCFYTSGGYRYPRGGDAGVIRQIQNLRQRLNADDPEGSARAYSELKDMYNTFVNQCQWTSGLRHPRFPHVVSGMTANQWVAENGWEFVSPGTGDLSVRRIPKAIKCSKCRGKCIYKIRVSCAVCKGARYVPNPVVVGTAVNFGLNTVRRRGRGRNLPSHIPTGPSKVPCSGCNAHGFVYNQIQCEQCRGTGIIYR